VNPDEEAEAALREAYGKRLSEAFSEFALSLGAAWMEKEAESVVRLFVHYGSFPAYSVWRNRVMGTTKEDLAQMRHEASLGHSEGKQASQAEPRLRAVQIKGGERATKDEWARMVAWAKRQGGRRIKGDDGKWNLTEDELAEALA